MLNSKQIKYLKSLANTIEAKYQYLKEAKEGFLVKGKKIYNYYWIFNYITLFGCI